MTPLRQLYTRNRGGKEEGRDIVNHKVKPEVSSTTNQSTYNPPITEADFKTFLDALSRGADYLTACQYARRSETGVRRYVLKDEDRGLRVERARADWKMVHLDRLNKTDDDGSGSSSRVRASLGALASVDKRYRKEVHVGGTQNIVNVIADPRPSGLIGNPDRYALSQEPMAQADATVRDTPAAESEPPAPAAPMPPKKGTPII